jgi:hypothetical protein
MQPLLQCKNREYYLLCVCVCVFVALGIQHAMRMCHIVICGLPDIRIFPHYLINGAILDKKILNRECVLIFCTACV